MTFDERQALGSNIHKLSTRNMKGIIKIIDDKKSNNQSGGMIEFDLNTLEEDKCRQLEDYVA